MELYECKELVRTLRIRVSKELDASNDACNTIDGHFSDMLNDIQHFIDKEDDERPRHSDFKEHNIWNHSQLGITK